MRVTKKTHPELWELAPQSKISELAGLSIDDDKYGKFRDEVKRTLSHLPEREQEIVALHMASTHAGFETPGAVKVSLEPRPIDGMHTVLLWVIIGLLIFVLLLFVLPGHAEAKRKPKQDAPITVIPLADASKVQLLKMLRDQDIAIIKKKNDELEMKQLDAEIEKIQNDINDLAGKLAAEDKIDANQLVLDLDKLAWVTKGTK